MPQPEGDAPNRLVHESSPYLLQHAHNPVDWYPWGAEAFEAARERNVPIFLSIGYSTCYWCHVMERESFEHGPTARLMNERFVCVKVDREERPDVDDLYMSATQIMTGRGGWPMSCFLEPERLRPFWCGTYFPREPRHGLPSFTQVLESMSQVWSTRRDEAIKQSEQVARAVREALATSREPVPIGPEHATQAVEHLLRTFDRTHAGFGGAPKFPQASNLFLLLEALGHAADPETRTGIETALRLTLERMAIGGLFDQVGAGFHRYCVDETWTVPHFEKMLYDNAQLATLYTLASRTFEDPYFETIARRTLDYTLREMTRAGEPGATGFFSAQDAEVDQREGLNYLWTPEEIRQVLPEADAELAIRLYMLDKGSNFQDPHHPDDPPRNVLRLSDRPDRLAVALGLTPEQLDGAMERINAALYAARAERKQPHLDDKVIASWNGMLIGALATGADAFAELRYHEGADHAARYILTEMRAPDGGLLRISRDGQSKTPALLEDHAALIAGLLALHRSRFSRDGKHLEGAIELAELAHQAFAGEDGGYYDTRADQDDLFVRSRMTYDGATPCASSIMLGALIDLYDATGERKWIDRAMGVLASLSPAIHDSPPSCVNSVRHLLRLVRRQDALPDSSLFEGAKPKRAPVAARAPVEVLASAEEVVVSAETPASFRLRLRVPEGYHVISADPGEGAGVLTPLRVGLVRGMGVSVYADYPEGEVLDAGVPGVGPVRVHHGTVEFEVALEAAPGVGASPGDPVLGVTFQACTETECLMPQTVELEVEIDLSP
jgi:hypothetical protein